MQSVAFRLSIALATLAPLGGCVADDNVNSASANRAATDSPTITPAVSDALALSPGWPDWLPPPELSGDVPLTVVLPTDATTTPTEARPGFDRFSWQSFIALNWPASAVRGVPEGPGDSALFRISNGSSTVWGTYREAYELFSQGDRRPPAWTVGDAPIEPCGEGGALKSMVMPTKGGTLLDEINEAFSYPLIDQHSNYTWSEVRFNKAMYEFVRGTEADDSSWLYLAKNLFDAQTAAENGIQMPASSDPDNHGALMVKASWRILENASRDEVDRYYSVTANLYDPEGGCVPRAVGLVGMHIVQKLEQFPEWIWSSFEHVDNVTVGADPPPGLGPTFNNGTNSPPTNNGFANKPKARVPPLLPPDSLTPVQVTRLNEIPTTPAGASTVEVNAVYQRLLKDTVWRNYQLVITQWPSNPGSFALPGDGGIYPGQSGGAFPVKGATNVAMETYFQADGLTAGLGNSCMECHYRAAKSDYSWALQNRAH